MTRILFALPAAAVLLAAGAAAAQTAPDYTRDLNAMPGAGPQPQPQPEPQPAPVVAAPASVQPAPPPRPAAQAASAPSPAPVAGETSTPAPAPAPAVAPAAPRVLSRAEIEALPFLVTLPPGYELTAGRPGPDFQVWTVRKGGLAQLMIYAGPASQFPIHDGEIVETGGRSTVVVVEDGRRRALEHLFRRSTAPNHIHVWIASVEGADRDRAEAIGHGISPR